MNKFLEADGEIKNIFLMQSSKKIIYKNKNETEMVATIETPDQMEKCVLFKLFDTTKAKTDKEKNE